MVRERNPTARWTVRSLWIVVMVVFIAIWAPTLWPLFQKHEELFFDEPGTIMAEPELDPNYNTAQVWVKVTKSGQEVRAFCYVEDNLVVGEKVVLVTWCDGLGTSYYPKEMTHWVNRTPPEPPRRRIQSTPMSKMPPDGG